MKRNNNFNIKNIGKGKTTAVILSAGKGSRMNSDIPKQYLEIDGRPVLYYTIRAFEESSVDDIIIVAAEEYQEYIQKDIIQKHEFKKISAIVEGGSERYLSVYNALKVISDSEYVLVHDGARPLIMPESIDKIIAGVRKKKACILAVKAKDTIKISDITGNVSETPDRNNMWVVQTPQAFEYNILIQAYEKAINDKDSRINITDDSMIVENYSDCKVAIVEGEYTNIKITTPEDMDIMKVLCNL